MPVAVHVPRHLGEAVLSLPALRGLADSLDEELLICAPEPAATVLRGQGRWRVGKPRGTEPAVLLSGSLRAALRAWRAPLRVGRATDHRGPLLTHPVPEAERLQPATGEGRPLPAMLPREHQGDAYTSVAAAAVVAQGESWDGPGSAEVGLDRADRDAGLAAWESLGRPELLLHPWAQGFARKRWPVERWIELGRALQARGAPFAVTGGPSSPDAALALEVAEGLGAPVAAGTDCLPIPVWAAVSRRVKASILPDTGLAHLAVAAGGSVVVLFGPTDPQRHGPRGPGRCAVVEQPLACRPCYGARCGHDGVCLTGIAAADVLEAVDRVGSA